jgi:hypothetical protein
VPVAGTLIAGLVTLAARLVLLVLVYRLAASPTKVRQAGYRKAGRSDDGG